MAPSPRDPASLCPSPLGAEDAEALVERLAAEMAERWRQGERPLSEEYLRLHPQLWEQPEAAVELIYEEICLREEHGQQAAAADLLLRFPQWRSQLRIVLDCHQLLEARAAAPDFPVVGEALGDFRLLAELGRGAQGRVFLATQPGLADRPVVLKLVPRDGLEHLSLARLQHTHVVPLYSVQDEPARNLRALCMPYFGGATLAHILEHLGGTAPEQRTGRHLLEALARAQGVAPIPFTSGGPVCQLLARASYIQAVCWMGACLADALHYAHERGLLHLDLKPSNVLWAADGQPMLLDFHLARAPLPAGGATPAWLGGTPAYMSPEHQAALAAVRGRRPVPAAVDGRADVYALGMLLLETLGGALPPPESPIVWLRRHNPRVTAGMADLLRKCLAPEPGQRYPNAADLAADLRRHLADLPLHGVPNRSWPERWRKWRRRRPHALPLVALLLLALAAGTIALVHTHWRLDEAQSALAEGESLLQQRRFVEAHTVLKRGLAQAERLPLAPGLTHRLSQQVQLAERAEACHELHLFVERVRVLFGVDALPSSELRTVETHCRAFWEMRDVIAQRLGQGAEVSPALAELEPQVHTDLLDLAILWTNLRLRLVGEDPADDVRREALEVLAQAEALFGPSPVLSHERQRHAEALGLTDLARAAARQAREVAPRTAWEHYALGRSFLQAGRLEEAAAELDRALDLQPQGLWLNFYKGRCAFQLRHFDEAVLAFTACVALAPDVAGFCYNRALAYTEAGHLDPALRDYDRALRLDAGLGLAALNRGLLHYRQQRYPAALTDLQLALDRGVDPATVSYNTALVHVARQDLSAARASLEHALRHDPGHRDAQRLWDQLREGR